MGVLEVGGLVHMGRLVDPKHVFVPLLLNIGSQFTRTRPCIQENTSLGVGLGQGRGRIKDGLVQLLGSVNLVVDMGRELVINILLPAYQELFVLDEPLLSPGGGGTMARGGWDTGDASSGLGTL